MPAPVDDPTRFGRLSRRRLLGQAGAIGAGAAGLALTGRGARSVAARPAGQDTVTLSWLTDFTTSEEFVARYAAVNPNVEVKPEIVTFREVFQQNQVRLGAKSDNPDVVAVDAPVVASYGLRGWLHPLDEYFTPEETAIWVDAQAVSSTYNGQRMSVPIWNSSQLLFYNADLLAAAGIEGPGPEDRWTWDQIAEAATAVTSGDVFGFQFEQYNRIYQLQPLPQGKGVPVIGEDGLTVKGIIDSPEWIEAFTWYAQAHNDWKIAPQGAIDVHELFINQKLAICIRGPWAIKSLTEANLPFQWRAAPHPSWGGEIHVPTDSWHMGVNPNGAHIEETVAFIKWASSVDGGRAWREIADSWPCEKALLDEIFNDPANADWPARANSIAAAEAQYATPRPLTPGYLEYEEILSDAFEDIRNGSDVAGALGSAADQIDREMQKYRQ